MTISAEINDTPAGSVGPPLPRVLACGHRKILIPKSGLIFPTFLVALPGLIKPVWRSKRDFLVLSRAVPPTRKFFPKTAFKKLAQTEPWRRPGMEGQPNEPNQFHVSMKKNLMQVDQFLQGAHESAHSIETSQCNEAWGVFCRAEDTKGLVSMNDTGHPARSQPEASMAAGTTHQESCRLGQYFCTKENAEHVVSLSLQHLGPKINDEATHLVFVEPSCGHGDIVGALVQELDKRDVSSKRVTIHAYDIDPHAIKKCTERSLPTSDHQVFWACENFLETKRPFHCDEKGTVVVCVGGPPYTTGAGSSVDMQRDLPTKFIQHCISEWDASIVSFLLPVRYREYEGFLDSGIQCKTVDLVSSKFFFQGSNPVTQPSILQCYFR